MKKKIAGILVISVGIFAVFTILFIYIINSHFKNDIVQNQVTLIHGIREATEDSGNVDVQGQIRELENSIESDNSSVIKQQMRKYILIYFVSMLVYVLIIFLYVYFKIIRPFGTLKKYSGEVAKGNLDAVLCVERNNFFGDFTWAFDHLREELKSAKNNEKRAIEENKTIIATLSHDIKTPIASIRAYSEGLEAGLDDSYEARERYISIILKKCDEVTSLTNDLVLHSLSQLESLEINCEEYDVGILLEGTVKDLEFSDINLKTPIPSAKCFVDSKRFAQVIENILNNARKYAAGTKVDISATIEEEMYKIVICDHGEGIPPENLPFIFNKFYRGSNVGEQPGSGLGLYIVKYILNRMNGDITLENYDDGLRVIIFLKIS